MMLADELFHLVLIERDYHRRGFSVEGNDVEAIAIPYLADDLAGPVLELADSDDRHAASARGLVNFRNAASFARP